MCICTCTIVQMCMQIYVCICPSTYIYIQTHMFMYTLVYALCICICVCVCVWLHVPSAKPAEQVDCYVTCARRLSTLPTACSTTSEAWSTVLCVCGHAVMPSRRPASVRRPQDCHGLTPTRALKRISPRQPGAKHLPNSHGSMVD